MDTYGQTVLVNARRIIVGGLSSDAQGSITDIAFDLAVSLGITADDDEDGIMITLLEVVTAMSPDLVARIFAATTAAAN